MPPTPVDQNTPLAITLTAQEWNAVLATLADGRFNVVSPLIQKIVEQAQKASADENAAYNQGQQAAGQSALGRLQPVS